MRIRTFQAIFLVANVLVWGGAEEAAAQWCTGTGLELVRSLKTLEELQNGLNALHGTLEYDPNIFEVPEQEDFTPMQLWDRLPFNPEKTDNLS